MGKLDDLNQAMRKRKIINDIAQVSDYNVMCCNDQHKGMKFT